MEEISITQLLRRWANTIIALAFIVGIFLFLGEIASLVKLAVIAALLAYMLDPVARYMESHGMSRTLATVIIFIGIVGLITALTFIFVPQMLEETSAVKNLVAAGKAREIISAYEETIKSKFGFMGLENLNFIDRATDYLKNASNQIYGYFMNAVAIVSNLFIIPFIMFFLIKDGRELIKYFVSLVPNRHFEFTLNLIHKTDKQLGDYIRGQFLDSAIIGLLAIIACWILDVKYFIIIGIFTGIANLVPFIGPIVGAIPAIIVALLMSGGLIKPLYVAAAFIGIQLIDNAVVKPVVVARMVSLHPLVVLLAVIIGGKFFGIMGMLLSVPAVGIAKVVGSEAISNYRKFRFI